MIYAKQRNFLTGDFRQRVAASNAGWLTLLVALSVMNLSACSDNTKNMTKILVTVNGDAITARQVDTELRLNNSNSTRKVSEAMESVIRRQTLETLIDRKLLLAEALRQKIDRNPEVIDFIERLKTQIIVQAYLDLQTTNADKPSRADVDAYFKAHPELFAHRKILEIQQLSIAAQDYSASLKQAMDQAGSLQQIALWLDAQKIAYIQSTHSYTSADMPTETINNLQALGRDHLFILKDGDQELLCALSELRDSPLTNEAATAQIEHHLFIQKMQQVALTKIAKLKLSSKINYVNDSAP